jgi:hypothetical protein
MVTPAFTPPAPSIPAKEERNDADNNALILATAINGGMLNKLSDVMALPDLQKRGPARFADDSVSPCGDTLGGGHEIDSGFQKDPFEDDEYCSLQMPTGGRSACESYYKREEMVPPEELDTSVEFAAGATILPEAPKLPLLEARDAGEHNQSEVRSLESHDMSSSSNQVEYENTRIDADPLSFSDPEVLTAMMSDVKLLGAHVDRLISNQQRLFSSGISSTLATATLGSEVQSLSPSPTDSLDAWASAGMESSWPSQPYDPSKYGTVSSSEETSYLGEVRNIGQSDTFSYPAWHVGAWSLAEDDIELHSMVDSFERQSSMFQARIRACAKRISERRRFGKDECSPSRRD